MSKWLTIATIKMIDIAFIVTLYILVGLPLSQILDYIFEKLFGKIEKKKMYNKISIIMQLIIQFIFIYITSYIGRNMIEYIPFPLDKYCGFNHLHVKEVTSGAALTTMLILFNVNLQNRIKYIRKNIINSE